VIYHLVVAEAGFPLSKKKVFRARSECLIKLLELFFSMCVDIYTAPEIYRHEPFDRSVDVFAFGLILYEMIEGNHAFHPKSQEEAAKMICLEGLRPPFKNKPKNYPSDVKELIQECWDPVPSVRPTFAEIIVRLNKIHASCAKQARWRDTFKLPWKHAGDR